MDLEELSVPRSCDGRTTRKNYFVQHFHRHTLLRLIENYGKKPIKLNKITNNFKFYINNY